MVLDFLRPPYYTEVCTILQPSTKVAEVLWSTQDDGGATAPEPKLDEVVCAHYFFSLERLYCTVLYCKLLRSARDDKGTTAQHQPAPKMD